MAISLASLKALPAEHYAQLLKSNVAQLSFSQFGEDVLLQNLFEGELRAGYRGKYVDFGCNHPFQYSNTMLLHMQGWQGLNVDANPEYIALFQEARPQDTNICAAIGTCAGEADFYRFYLGAVSTLCPRQAEQWQVENGWKLRDIIKVTVFTVNEILDRHLPKGEQIDYMNMDIEGVDEDVIRQLDFHTWRPKVLTIEVHGLCLVDVGANATVQFVRNQGYELLAVCGLTLVFKRVR